MGYSLLQMFNYKEDIAKQFVGGAILQVFFSAHKYHWYHSPVDGEVEVAERAPGIVYAIDELNDHAYRNITKGKLDLWIIHNQDGLINTELYLGHVATRCIFVIRSPTLGKVGLVFIGMTEISSCVILKNVGDQVEKGEKLGHFQFGGSSGLVVIEEKTIKAAGGNDIWEKNISEGPWKMCEKIIDL